MFAAHFKWIQYVPHTYVRWPSKCVLMSLYKCNACIWALYPLDCTVGCKEKWSFTRSIDRANRQTKNRNTHTHTQRKDRGGRGDWSCSFAPVFVLSTPLSSHLPVVYLSPSLIYIFCQIFTVYSMCSHRSFSCDYVCKCCLHDDGILLLLLPRFLLVISSEIEDAMSQREWYLRISVKVFRIDFDFCEKHFGQKLH